MDKGHRRAHEVKGHRRAIVNLTLVNNVETFNFNHNLNPC